MWEYNLELAGDPLYSLTARGTEDEAADEAADEVASDVYEWDHEDGDDFDGPDDMSDDDAGAA